MAFYSRKLTQAETRYSTFDRELLVCVAAIRHFRFLVEGRSFIIWTDHKPLTFALHKMTDAWSARQQRHLAYVAEFCSELRHVPGKMNVVADSLSRPPAEAATPPAVCAGVPTASSGPLSWRFIAAGQSMCQETMKLVASSSLQLQGMEIEGGKLWCDVSTGVWRPLIACEHRRQIFQRIQGSTSWRMQGPGPRAG